MSLETQKVKITYFRTQEAPNFLLNDFCYRNTRTTCGGSAGEGEEEVGPCMGWEVLEEP